jgi:hypothetical protein
MNDRWKRAKGALLALFLAESRDLLPAGAVNVQISRINAVAPWQR